MDKCIYNGITYNSFDVAADIDLESMIRQCKNLLCCDPDCNTPVIYKHGKYRIPYFAHKMKSELCEYERYCNDQSHVFKKVQEDIYSVLKKKYPVDIDVKIIRKPAHYSPIIIKEPRRIAVDITDKCATANTLKSRKNAYAELNYLGIQIIVDNEYEHELCDSEDLYYPVRFELHKSLNRTAIVYDKSSQKYYYLKYDDSRYGNGFYIKNILSREFDISELTVTEQGFSVPRLDEEFKNWVNERKENYNAYLKEKEERLEAAKSLEKRKNQYEKANAIISGKTTPSVPQKPVFDSVAFHKQTGRYSGNVIKGIRVSFALDEISINKSAPNYYKVYSEAEMEELINNAFSFKASDIQQFLNKMYHANDDEKAVFVRIYEEYLNAEPTKENTERLKILEYAIEEAEVFGK